MERKTLKLAIIQKITACEDDQVLQTIWSILEQLSSSSQVNPVDTAPLIEALLGDSGKNNTPPSAQEIADLQQSINDIFGQEN